MTNRAVKNCVMAFVVSFLNLHLIASAQQSTDSVTLPNQSTEVDEQTPKQLYRLNGTYLKSYWTDFKGVAAAPFHWKGKNWKTFAIVAGAAGLLYAKADRPVQKIMLRNQKEFLSSTSDVVYPFGNRFPPFLITGMYVTGLIFKDRQLEHSSLSIARALAISTVFYTSSKALIRRNRPALTTNPHLFAKPFTNKEYSSFPSGHSNTVFSVATAFALEYKGKKWVPWVTYSIATLTAVSRIYQNRHWSSDVLIGSAIGHFVTKTIYKLEEKRQSAKTLNTSFLDKRF